MNTISSKINFVLISFLIFSNYSIAQLTTSTAMTPTQMVQNVLLGSGITATNITYSGAALSRGTFNGAASNIGLASGVIMSSGDIANACGPNNQSGISTSNSLLGDADLDIIMSPTLSYDAAVIEFDFVPTSDTVKFRYVFGSDEYMEFVSSIPGGINDGFGFFISGPGITGPFANNAKNIALVPGTSLPVTMFNLNLNNNSAYYFDNGDGFGSGTAPNGLTVQYDGFTKPLTAITQVQCGQTYHIKLAIADGGDGIIDSGVFLEAGSFASTGNVFMSSSTSFGGNVNSNNDTMMYEGCGSASILFDRGINNLAVADTFYYSLSGTATNGLDFSMIGDSVYFAPGQATANVIVNSLPDVLVEGTETVTFSVYVASPCNGNDTISLTLYILDSPPMTISLNNDTTLGCPTNSLALSAVGHGGVGIGNCNYVWANTTSTSNTINVNPTVTTTYYVTISDTCGNSATDSVKVTVVPYTPLQLSFNNDTIICGGNEVLLNSDVTGGRPAYIYSWSPNVTLSDSVTVAPAYPTTYMLTITDACNHTVSDSMHITVYPIHADFSHTFSTNQTVQFINESIGAVSYFWNFGDGSQDSTSTETNPIHFYPNDGSYLVTLISTNIEGCADTIILPVVVLPDFYFYYPNAFTPNNNENNDVYRGYGSGIKTYHMSIFDRWGEKLFETTDINTGWDGTYKGVKLSEGIYICKFELTGFHFEEKYYIGHVNLIR